MQLFTGTPQNFQIFALFDLPKMGNLMIPEQSKTTTHTNHTTLGNVPLQRSSQTRVLRRQRSDIVFWIAGRRQRLPDGCACRKIILGLHKMPERKYKFSQIVVWWWWIPWWNPLYKITKKQIQAYCGRKKINLSWTNQALPEINGCFLLNFSTVATLLKISQVPESFRDSKDPH